MWTKLHWVDGPWPGKLALAARPRGGDWLNDEIASWRRRTVDTVVSLLTGEEERDLELSAEAPEVRAHGMGFISLPIADRQVPASSHDFEHALQQIESELAAGRNVVVHCRQGVGRTGLVAACLLVARGTDPQTAVEQLSLARGAAVPETEAQRQWIDRYAASSVAPR